MIDHFEFLFLSFERAQKHVRNPMPRTRVSSILSRWTCAPYLTVGPRAAIRTSLVGWATQWQGVRTFPSKKSDPYQGTQTGGRSAAIENPHRVGLLILW